MQEYRWLCENIDTKGLSRWTNQELNTMCVGEWIREQTTDRTAGDGSKTKKKQAEVHGELTVFVLYVISHCMLWEREFIPHFL